MLDAAKLALIDEQAAMRLQRVPTTFPSIENDAHPEPHHVAALDLRDLAQRHFKRRDPLLEPWLCSQDLAMVFAGRGIGKTHFALAIAFAVATGGAFGKWTAPAPAKVLYLDGELAGAVFQKRLAMHLPDVEPAPGYFKAFTPDLLPDGVPMPDLSTPEGQTVVDHMLEPDTSLVIVDNLSAWCRSGRENEAESWHPIAEWILQLRRRGMAVLLIHHAGKGGQQRGTSKREDLLDVVIGLSRPKDYEAKQGAVFVCEFTKARNLSGEDADSLEFELGGDDDRAVWKFSTVEASTFDRVVALAGEGLSQSEIAAELDLNKSNVSRHLRKARELGLVTTDATSRGVK